MMFWRVVPFIIATWLTTQSVNAEPFSRPFGERAPWNVPVAEIERHPESVSFVDRLWEAAPSNHAGNINLSFDEYTYPVYTVLDAIGLYPVRIRTGGGLDGTTLPWNPKWKPGEGTDAQVILLDPVQGIEWDLWQVEFDGQAIWASNGSRVYGDYRTLETGHQPSRGAGIPYLAMLVRPQEIMTGAIRHALSLTVKNTDGYSFLPPATKLEFPGRRAGGIPEGMRFAIDVTDAEIERWLSELPDQLSPQTKRSAAIIARALRDYGCFVTDTAGGAHLQFESRLTAGKQWSELGLDTLEIDDKEYPRDLLDGLLTPERLYALVPSDSYPAHLMPEGSGNDQ